MAPVVLLTALLFQSGSSSAPYYIEASIANSAAGVANYYAPNTFVTIYGVNLAYVTKAMTADDLSGTTLPTALIGTGVRVLVNNIAADIYYVSPSQINFLIPTLLIAGPATVQVEVDGLAGPPVTIMLGATAPTLFQLDPATVLAAHLDGSTVTADSPAQSGEVIVLYATGLGPTVPAAIPNQVPTSLAVVAAVDFQVLLNGVAVDRSQVLYAGVAPGYGGLYQINLRLAANAPQNPEVRVGTPAQMSLPGLYLPVQ
jgi:uncharacterized protein (TIGR03437 family)